MNILQIKHKPFQRFCRSQLLSFNQATVRILHLISWPACVLPIYTLGTLVILAILAYIGTLTCDSIDTFDSTKIASWPSLVAGSRSIQAGDYTDWSWKFCDAEVAQDSLAPHLAIVVAHRPLDRFNDHTSWRSLNVSNFVAHEGVLALSAPFGVESKLFNYIEIETEAIKVGGHSLTTADAMPSDKQSPKRLFSIIEHLHETWTGNHSLKKYAKWAHYTITASQWIALHLTVGLHYLSMQRLGSKFWLATGSLLSSSFAFLFGLLVTVSLGYPITPIELLKWIPYFVNIIGFNKYFTLTEAVLNFKAHKSLNNPDKPASSLGPIKHEAIRFAILTFGPALAKRYTAEVLISLMGAHLAGQVFENLCSFGILAACTLAFDSVLLFTWFVAVLTVKIEITRLKRDQEFSESKEGKSPFAGAFRSNVSTLTSPMSRWINRQNWNYLPNGKSNMIKAFVALRIIQFGSLIFSESPPMLPYRQTSWRFDTSNVAGSEGLPVAAKMLLKEILREAKRLHSGIIVTILPTITQGNPAMDGYSTPNLRYSRMVQGILRGFEDPLLSKFVLIALVVSGILNGFLFKLATRRLERGSDSRTVKIHALMSNKQEMLTSETRLHSVVHDKSPEVIAKVSDEMTDKALPHTHADPRLPKAKRSLSEMKELLKAARSAEMTDEEVLGLVIDEHLPPHALEVALKDFTRAVMIRRRFISRHGATSSRTKELESSKLPFEQYNYSALFGACCENVIGFMPVPVGVAGPLIVDGQSFFIPMATTEGVLIASTSRGCKAINAGGGAHTIITNDGMTRGPCVKFSTIERTGEALRWLNSEQGQTEMKNAFNSTSRFARLMSVKTATTGVEVFIRFRASTGDAMGMNMISKGVEQCLNAIRDNGFDDMQIVTLSGNYCSDKKSTAINWIEGRGKGVVAQAVIPSEVVSSTLKTDVDTLVSLNISKNLVGSAMAGSIGGFNAHAANIVAAVYIATGQDPAQVVESANCITTMRNLEGSLQVCVAMPSVEVGTIGGGTLLGPQAAMLDMLGVRGPNRDNPGENARTLARLIAATTLAGEISLCAALAAGHLVQAHMKHNRGGNK
ncbi:Hypothetical protein R9X50_00648200 [Acrodontium crateriforme]|uniref:3-hydroxy-3-methylglutaryl coenzyme A reductase n=1 Tax=Acrodontium crateriforme TaxID=150365 RepID=A0AAQ3RC67_9PEZI|nr:Hypothetical protein R9X50_00648200 [Acrodontium crateriforme]